MIPKTFKLGGVEWAVCISQLKEDEGEFGREAIDNWRLRRLEAKMAAKDRIPWKRKRFPSLP